MNQFIARFEDQIQGTLSGFDRVVLRGSLRRLTHSQGMKMYLIRNQILCRDYLDHVREVSQDLKDASLAPFRQRQLPVFHVSSPKANKEQIARAFAEERNIVEGDVCALTAMELTPTFQHDKTTMAVRYRPTLVIYHYRIDPEFGWMNARIQTWFPFYIHVCINGREWLARRMNREGLKYCRQDNCFPWIEDLKQAQGLMDEQLQTDWASRLQPAAARLNPLHERIFAQFDATCYWSSVQCEWATDVVFRAGALQRLEPLLLRHGLLNFSSPDVLRFWGRRIGVSGAGLDRFPAEITTSLKARVTGERLKHWTQGNSLKLYGKAHTPVGDVLRVETMTSNVEVFRTYRPAEGGDEDDLAWRRMRRGVADLHRRAQISQKTNERYLNAFATVDDATRFAELIQPLEQPRMYRNRRVRALRPFDQEDYRLLEAVQRGEFAINGLRNRDLQNLLYPPAANCAAEPEARDKKRRSAAISRKLRLMRAHGLIHKVPKTHRYQLTNTGRLAIAAILTIHQSSMTVINRLAA
jgi:hypothetical protein